MFLLGSLEGSEVEKMHFTYFSVSAAFQQVNNIPISASKCKTNDVDWSGESGQTCLGPLN